MDYNGDATGGVGSLPDPLDIPAICAEDGTFQRLDVGPCGGPALYQLPRIAKGAQPRAVIVDESAQTVNISEIQRVMQAFYVAIDSFTIPSAGNYTIDELVQLVQDGFNTKYAAETNALTMWVGNDGHVRARITAGSQPSFRMVETLGLLQMGNTADSGAIPPNTTYRFPSLPNYSGIVQQSGWRGYNFDESGYIFEGDMRITGSLEVSTIVSDLEVEDSLIFINKNAPVDGFSTGLVVNTFNNTRFGGLVKADSSPSWFLFSNSATIPTASGWTPEQTGNLYITDLGAAGQVTIGAPASSYSLPTARGNDGDVLISDAVGNVSWQVPPGALRLQDGTGVITGGLLTVNADTTKFDVSAGTGQVIDPVTGVVTDVVWPTFTAQTFAYSGILTFISISSGAAIIASSTRPTPAETRDQIYLGVLVHVNGVNLDATNDQQSVVSSTANQVRDFMDALGFLNIEGNQLSPSILLTFQKSQGLMLAFGSNFKNDPKDPHRIVLPAVDTNAGGIFQYRMRDGSSSVLTLTDIDPAILDDGTPYPGAIVPNNKFTIQHVYGFSSNNIKIQPGQNVYNSFAEAQAALPYENYIEEPSLSNGIFLGHLIVKKECADLNTATDAQFFNAGKFGSISATAVASSDRIISPDGLNEVVAQNNQILTKYGGANRVYVDATTSDILSGDSSYVMSVSNSRLLVSDPTPGGRFELNNAETFLKSPDKSTLITLLDNDMYADVGGTQSFRATPTVTTLKGGGGNNPTITLQSGTSSWVHSTRECLTTAPTAVEIGYDAGTATYNKFEAAGFTKYHAGTIRETVDASNTFLYSPDGVSSSIRMGNTLYLAKVAAVDRFKIDTAESLLEAPNSINSVGVSNIQTRVNGQFAVNGLARFESTGVELLNGVPLRLGHTSASVEKPVSVLMVSNANIIKGIVLKIVNVGGSARVEPVGTADPDSTSIIGVSLAAAVIGGNVEVAVGGLFECSIQSGVTVTVGDSVEKSDAETGRIIPVAPNPGTFGVALTTATGSVDGSVRALVMFKKNEAL